jgi:N-acetylneuraminate synthase
VSRAVEIAGRPIGRGHPTYIIAEIGINHNGSIEIAKDLIDLARDSGCDAVKFQKRTPELCVPDEMKNVVRETPWGLMTYMEYRDRIEFQYDDYAQIDSYCKEKGITWFASCWDIPSVEFIEQFSPVCYKIASATLTNDELLGRINATGVPIIMSTGMSTISQIRKAASMVDPGRLLLAHCTSAYPCRPSELNLLMIKTLSEEFDCPIGYSGHEVGLQTTYAAVVLGACFVERHITLDRAMWGSDQNASLEPPGVRRLVRDIRVIEQAMGDGVKRIYESEEALLRRLRLYT